MKKTWWFLLCLLLLAGCARSTVEKRRHERLSAYTALPPETRQLVDEGHIQIGMSMDAVYIAWGKPDQEVASDSSQGSVVTWLYHDTKLETHYYWTHRTVRYKRYYRSEPYLEHDYYVRPYVSAEIVFQEGVVKEWRTLPYPVY